MVKAAQSFFPSFFPFTLFSPYWVFSSEQRSIKAALWARTLNMHMCVHAKHAKRKVGDI